MTYDNSDNKKQRIKKAGKGRTMGLVVATAVAATPVVGCDNDRTALMSDAGTQMEAAASPDTGSPSDAPLAMDATSSPDGTAIPADAALDVYPDGVRG